MNTGNELDTSREACPSPHSRANKIGRVLWGLCWLLMFRPSPRLLFQWRVILLRIFGADVDWNSRIDPSVRIWAPWNLRIGRDASIGHHADIYNVAKITIGNHATVSQYGYLCSASHDLADPTMSLTSSPIEIGPAAWVCARAFVGPGVTVGEGAVAGACAVVVKDVADWMIVAGNPAREIRRRELACNGESVS
ncbi:MAG: putative colanic acid biosynthesis acetyltransferase [Planctomycetota bacterium]